MRLDLPRDQKYEMVSMSYLISSNLLRQMLEFLRWNSTYKDTFLGATLGAHVIDINLDMFLIVISPRKFDLGFDWI